MPEGFPGLCSPSTLIADKSFAHIIHRTALRFPRCADHVLWSFNSHHILSSRYLPTHAMRSAWLDDGILPSTSLQTIQDTFCNKHKKALCVLTSNTSSLVQTCDHVAAGLAAMAWSQFDSPGAFRHLPSSQISLYLAWHGRARLMCALPSQKQGHPLSQPSKTQCRPEPSLLKGATPL